jgi:hypothetical protein
LNRYLRPRRSGVTWGKGGPHSGYRHLADKDEVPGSSPGRPTTHRRRSERCCPQAGRTHWLPGPRWGRTPIPAGKLIGPSVPVHPGVNLHDHHPPWSRTQPRTAATRQGRQPRAAACSRAHSAAASHGRSARRPGLPGQSAGKRRRPHTTQPGRRRHPHRPTRSRQRRPLPGPLGRRPSRSTVRQPIGTSPVPVVQCPGRTGLVPNATA